MPLTVIKRDGSAVPFDTKKIKTVIKKAAGKAMKASDIQYVTDQVKDYFADDTEISVEEIQDEVENALMHSRFTDVAREYVRYRQLHEIRRKSNDALMEEYNDLLFTDPKDMDLKRDNANINTDAPMGIMLKLGTEGAKSYVYNYFLDEDVSKACKEGILHYHDADFSLITYNCLQSRLAKILKGGFNTGHGFLREPNSIRSAAALTAISIQSSQNDLFGGQAINAFDYDLAPYVNKSFRKYLQQGLDEWGRFHKFKEWANNHELYSDLTEANGACVPRVITGRENQDEIQYGVNKERVISIMQDAFEHTNCELDDENAKTIYDIACEKTKDETHQAMEAFIHNMNTLKEIEA